MIWVSFCCFTNRYWSNSKMTSISYNYNTEYTTKFEDSLAWYDVAINSTIETCRISRYINLKLPFCIVFVRHIDVHINFQFIPNCQKLWHLKNQLFLLMHTACMSHALPLSLLPFTRDTHMVCLQWNVSQCLQIWIFNISNTDSCTQTIYPWYKYYSKWICVSFSFQYT